MGTLKFKSLFEVNTKCSKTHIGTQKCFNVYLKRISGSFISLRKPCNTFNVIILEDKIASAIYEQQQASRRTENG